MEILIGCSGFGRQLARYSQDFSLQELENTFFRMPRPAEGRKLKELVPADFTFSLQAWQLITHSPPYTRLGKPPKLAREEKLGHLQLSRDVRAAWKRTVAVAEALAARYVVLRTPTSFAPSQESRDRLSAFVQTLGPFPFTLVWEPAGAWQANQVFHLCQELKILPAVDPLLTESPIEAPALTEGPRWMGKEAYFRLPGGGFFGDDYDDFRLEQLLSICQNYEKCVCVFTNVHKIRSARRFKELVNGAQPAAPLP